MTNYNQYLNFKIFLKNYLTYKRLLNYKHIFIINV